MTEPRTFTYQTRLVVNSEQAEALDTYAALYGKVERALFAALARGGDAGKLKSATMARFGLTARQYNAIAAALRGKVSSIQQRRAGLIREARGRVLALARKITKLQARRPADADGRHDLAAQLHQKRRRLATRKARLAGMIADQKAGRVRLCFGGRKLFHAQFDLAAHGYASMDVWRQAWRAARTAQFFVLGSQDETAGCQSCVAGEQPDGTLTLHLRLPNALGAGHGKVLALEGVRFAYGHDAILAALHAGVKAQVIGRSGQSRIKRTGVPISYRFVRDAKGWRVFATTRVAAPVPASSRMAGAVGIDINADHLAMGEVDRFGNPVYARRLPLVTYGLTQHQTIARIGDVAKAIARHAAAAGKPVVIEDLEFSKKKAALHEQSVRYARMLSAFAYHGTRAAIEAACFRVGVGVIAVNPAYTSTIGAVNYARRLGISVHQGAAVAIARRGLGLSERPTVRRAIVPMRNGGHVTFDLPVRNRSKHVWSFWSRTLGRLKATHAAWSRSGGRKRPPAPLPRFSSGHRALLGSVGATPARESSAALFG